MSTIQYPINNKAIYRTWILVVLWVFQMLSEIAVIAVGAIRVGYVSWIMNTTFVAYTYSCNDDDTDCQTTSRNYNFKNSPSVGFALASSVLALVFVLVFFITHIVQIVQYARRRLSPKTNFAYDCFRFVSTTLYFILIIVSAALTGISILILVFSILNWILYLMGLIYASILFHRFRKGQYANVAPTSNSSPQIESQSVLPNKQEANYSSGNYQQPYQSAPGVVPTPPNFRH